MLRSWTEIQNYDAFCLVQKLQFYAQATSVNFKAEHTTRPRVIIPLLL